MSDERSGCLKKGCLGCLALFVITALIVAMLVVIGVKQATREPDVRSIDESQSIRSPRVAPDADAIEAAPSAPVIVGEPGRVVLDVRMIEFRIEPAPAGTPIRLEGAYDAGKIQVEQSYVPEGELGWRYRLSVRRRGLLPMFVSSGGEQNLLTLYLPRDAPISLSGLVGLGESHLQLGGLWLIDVDLDIGSGQHEISFDEPLAAPLARFRVDGSFGEFDIEDLGNASPVEASIEHAAGEVQVDLSGAWRADGSVRVRCGFGECGVRLPRDARVELDVPRLMFGEASVRTPRRREGDEALPLVRVAVSASAGEVRVD